MAHGSGEAILNYASAEAEYFSISVTRSLIRIPINDVFTDIEVKACFRDLNKALFIAILPVLELMN